MSICIFCHKDASTSKSVEHIIPESLGNKHHLLPKGYVCDKCNNYFSVKIEKELLAQPYFVSMRFRNEILTKKNKLVKERIRFPEVCINAEAILQTSLKGMTISFDDDVLYKKIQDEKIKTIELSYIPEPTYPNRILSRFLAKCAYEFFLYNVGKDKYDLCVQELLGKENDILKNLREYARFGKGKYWSYSQRRIYSEGDVVYNQSKGLYLEKLYEMKFFTKEYNEMPNYDVEVEIYFVMAILGIEYAICISDPDISEYQKWLEEHKGVSPLTNEEQEMHFSLSTVKPILIKKDDDRIY